MTQEINPNGDEPTRMAENDVELPIEVEPDQWYKITSVDDPDPDSFAHYVLGTELLENVNETRATKNNPFVYHYGDGLIVETRWRRHENCVYWGDIEQIHTAADIPAEDSEIRRAEMEVLE